MKKGWYIVFIACLAMLPCLGGYADVVVDDVYYWQEGNVAETVEWTETVDDSAIYSEEVDTETLEPEIVTITFVEDSVTQRSDNTVVKAVIKRY
ncbi:MAG: hypothetical protein ACI4BD_04625 [Paludibacteraceae bacterium]